jgi:GNAT superfamily N-acetyltransferase
MKIVPMDKKFVLYRCLHAGLLSPSNIELRSTNVPGLPKEQIDRNKMLLTRLVDTYGTCAMLAVEGEYVVGYARFYPDIVYGLAGRKHICCQDRQSPITSEMAEMEIPKYDSLTDRTLRINCWFIHGDYRNRGLSHLLLQSILDWAYDHGWKTVRASAAVDNYWVASQACALMLHTYEKHDFKKISTNPSAGLRDYLTQFKQGKFGVARQQELERHCREEDLSEIAVYHTVECALDKEASLS